MKKPCLNILSTIIFACLVVPAGAQDFEWVKQLGLFGTSSGNYIATDRSGNVLTVGFFSGPTDFDPGPNTFTLASTDLGSMFISKLDSSGGFLWAKSLNKCTDANIATDKYGNAFILGTFSGTVDIDPSAATFTIGSTNSPHLTFILKLDPAGNFMWAKAIPSIQGYGRCYGLTIGLDSDQNIYTTGYFYGAADFDPDTSTYFLYSGYTPQPSTGSSPTDDFFLLKLDSIGKFISVKTIQDDYHNTSGKGSTNLAGETIVYGIKRFVFSTPSADCSFFIKYDVNGTVVWSKTIYGIKSSVYSVATDPINNICVVGDFKGTVDFDPGPDTVNLSSPSSSASSIYILQLNSSGDFIQAQQIDPTPDGFVTASQIITDASGSIYISGSFKGVIDFAPNIGQTVNLNSAAGSGFILKLNPYGEFEWVKQIGESSKSSICSIALDDFGNLYTTGFFTSTVDFDPGTGTYNLAAAGNQDIFIHKLSGPLVTGIGEQSLNVDFTAFPNPTSSKVYLNATANLENVICRIIDLNGKVVQEKSRINGLSFALDLSEQPDGLYILEVSDSRTIAKIKLLKR